MKRIITKYWWILPCLLGLYSFVGAGLKTWLWAVDWSEKIFVIFLILMLAVVLILTILALLTSWAVLLSSKQWLKFLISLLLLVVAIMLSLKPLSSLRIFNPPTSNYECDTLSVESDSIMVLDDTDTNRVNSDLSE